jgi:hypothetical protein
MPDTPSDLHERLTSWRKVAAEAKAGAARRKQPARQETEEHFVQVAML